MCAVDLDLEQIKKWKRTGFADKHDFCFCAFWIDARSEIPFAEKLPAGSASGRG